MAALLIALVLTATGIPRFADPQLNDLAQQRAIETTTNWNHRPLTELDNGRWALWGEILAYRGGDPTPAAEIVAGWMASPEHAAILKDRRFSHIGCGAAWVGQRLYAVCILADSAGTAVVPPVPPEPPVPAPTPPEVRPSVPPAVSVLPDTSISPN